MSSKHLKLNIHGVVQGVNFRTSTLEKARELGLSGFVRNEPDGSVYVEVEGDGDDLNGFAEWCYEGPYGSNVSRVDIVEGENRGYVGFEIRR